MGLVLIEYSLVKVVADLTSFFHTYVNVRFPSLDHKGKIFWKL